MPDQANHLRQLAQSCASNPTAPAARRRPFLLLVAGGKGGVGTTTVAVHLAAALSTGGRRTVLVDADSHGGDAAVLCGIEPRFNLADLLDGGRSVHEVLHDAPGGIRLLPGLWRPRDATDDTTPLANRLRAALDALAQDADVVLCDVGLGTSRFARAAQSMAQLLLAVTTTQPASILGAYALRRMVAEQSDGLPVHVLVNRAPNAALANEVNRRLDRTCRRFLRAPMAPAGHLPADPAAARHPIAAIARHLASLADRLATGPIRSHLASNTQTAQQDNQRNLPVQIPAHGNTPENLTAPRIGKIDSTPLAPQPI